MGYKKAYALFYFVDNFAKRRPNLTAFVIPGLYICTAVKFTTAPPVVTR